MVRLLTQIRAVALLFLLLCAFHPVRGAAAPCTGDVDGDGQVTVGDLATVIVAVAGDADGNPTLRAKADVNRDSAVTAADIVEVIELQGTPCSASASPTPTPSAQTPTGTPSTRTPTHSPGSSPTRTATSKTPSATPTVTGTPTSTFTHVPTATPTMVCTPVAEITLGSTPTNINGTLAAGSCTRVIENKVRYTDIYSVAGTPGTAIKISVVPAPGVTPIVPFITVTDADGQFGPADGAGGSPIEFYVTTTKPYQFMVTSSATTVPFGSYTLTVTRIACPTPVPLTFSAGHTTSLPSQALLDTECPDPGSPSRAAEINPADIYTFNVSQAPANVSITMRQSQAIDNLIATLTVRAPNDLPGGTWYNGLELVSFDLDTDCSSPTGNTTCAQVQFLALQPGAYTIVASGGIGSYSLSLASPLCPSTPLTGIPSAGPLQCNQGRACACSQQVGQSSDVCGGTFTPNTACAAPLQIPGISDGEPEDVASPSDMYTFTGSAGDVISVLMTSDDDAHLYLLGPAPGNALIAQDDNSGDGTSAATNDAELAATLVQSGTYTIVAANNRQVDPTCAPSNPSACLNYTLYLQKCPASALLPGQTITDSFKGFDCVGYGGIPYRTYHFNGTAGQMLSASVTSADVDAFVRILGSDGSQVQNDTDPFATLGTDARASRILPQSGTYFVEVSTNLDAGMIDTTVSPPPGFSVSALTCPAVPTTPGTINGSFGGSSCTLPGGQKFAVYSFTPGTLPGVASIMPPSNGCVLDLTAEGPQTPDQGCSPTVADMPLMSTGVYGFIVAGNDPTVTGAYAVQFNKCPLQSVTFGDVINATLAAGDCAAGNGLPGNWYLVHGPADIVQFNAPFSGSVKAGFPISGVLTDVTGSFGITVDFADDPSPPNPMFQFPLPPSTAPPPPFGGDLAFLLRIAGATAGDGGPYVLQTDPAAFR